MINNPLTNNRKDEKGLWNSFPNFLLINLAIVLALSLFFCPSCFLSWEGLKGMFPDFIFSFLITMAMSYGGSRIEWFLDKHISWIHRPIIRLCATSIIYMSYAFVALFILVYLYWMLYSDATVEHIPWKALVSYTFLPMGIGLGFMALFTTRSWLMEWKKSALEAEKLKNEKISSLYQSLKDQLNPHFLFNSLNVLSNLVYEDADKSAEFIQKLSKIYRYVLEVQNEELIRLDRELQFAQNYLDLQQVRFGDSLQVKISVESTDHVYLPPLSLQLLLENAIKHNVASNAHPLHISIERKNQELWISNSIKLKLNQEDESTGVGLENIRQRYLMLSNKVIHISQNNDTFLVVLPLLEIKD